MRKHTVYVRDKMQKRYRYALSAPTGRDFDPEFKPQLTPAQMLQLGVFCGKYMTDCRNEFPKSWFAKAKFARGKRDCSLNFFRIDASQPLSEWRRKGWIHRDDPRGWFQWYCRYYMGRRLPEEDARQSNAGRQFAATFGKSRRIANLAICCVARGNVRHYFTGPMTAGRFRRQCSIHISVYIA